MGHESIIRTGCLPVLSRPQRLQCALREANLTQVHLLETEIHTEKAIQPQHRVAVLYDVGTFISYKGNFI
jgi:hypothetical protein